MAVGNAGTSLQGAYVGGNTINVSSTYGTVQINNSDVTTPLVMMSSVSGNEAAYLPTPRATIWVRISTVSTTYDNQIIWKTAGGDGVLRVVSLSSSQTWTLPDASRIIALRSDIVNNYANGVSFGDGTDTLTITRTGGLFSLTATIPVENDNLFG